MEEKTIYEFQLKHIIDVLDRVSRIHGCSQLTCCFDRDVIQARKYSENALAGKKEEHVQRGVN